MSDENKFSLMDLGEVSQPVSIFIEKISSAIGIIYEPTKIKRLAKAEVAASIIRAKGELKLSEIQNRAIDRVLIEETRNQKNIESITTQAIPLLTESSCANLMDDDWIVNFFNKAKLFSDEQMQQLWAKILAGESNRPGSFSKRTVNFLSELDKSDAEKFTRLCGYCIKYLDGMHPIIITHSDSIYKENGFHFGDIVDLDSLGLIQFDGEARYALTGLNTYSKVDYFGETILLIMDSDDAILGIGCVVFTNLGVELSSLCEAKPVPNFSAYLKECWATHIVSPSISS